MKKAIAKQLNRLSAELPKKYVVEQITIQESGYRLNRSAFGEKRKFDETKMYDIPFIQLRAVEHKQQLKDSVKRFGVDGVGKYLGGL